LETAERTPGKWLWPYEVSALFEKAGLYPVPHSTLRDWTAQGRIAALRTPGGHRRYRESDALALLATLIKAAA
jgi:excisionase family DNA binding protein